MPQVVCSHCGESHPASTAFCPNTGKSLAATGASSAPSGTGERKSVPSWITDPQGGSSAPVRGTGQGDAFIGDGGETPEVGVFDLLKRALQLYKTHARVLLTVAAVVFVPGALAHSCARAVILAPTVVGAVTIDPVTHLPAALGTPSVVAGFTVMLLGLLAAAVTGLFLHGIIVPLAHGALALTAADRITGGTAEWREVWRWLFGRLGTILSAVIPAALLIGVGFFFLIVPGLVLGFFFTFVPTVATFEGVGGIAALKRSYALVRSDWLRMLLILLVLAVISMLAKILASVVSGGLFGSCLLQDLLTLVAMPIPVLGSVLLYFDVRRKHDAGGFTSRQLAEELRALREG